ncbi:helix-turn-helix domain-containing protein [Streptomyces boncukensis]|uniref:Helix-turn-helix domain-containing protein n=1 Tax=Streptomyces boncukensis TaxID=2711219 RepID=A0A6G4X5I5_9ACTN|nr:helix-turn-helix domain-containing protein [Streptomyces boncukensis]
MDQQPTRFGPELRRRRLEAGLTLSGLAALVHYSKGQLSKVERGLKTPSPQLARLCDTALSADGALADLIPLHRAPEPPGNGVPTARKPEDATEGEAWLMHLSAEGPSWFQPVDRRTLMAAGAAGAASVVPLGAVRPVGPVPHPDDTTVLSAARSLFDQYRRLGQSTGPQLVLPPLIAQTHSLRQLASRSGPRTRHRLLALASRYAEYIGWLVQESGDDRGALRWTDHAVQLAEAGGDRDLAAYALVRRALVTLYRDDAAQTVELARRAQETGRPPRIRGLAAQREAQGHALAADYDACMRCLDRARELLTRESDEGSGAPVIGTTALPDPVAMITGWCLYDLGRPREAATVLDRETARLPADALRSQARYGLRRALAHAAAGETDHACTLTEALVPATDAVSSATVAADLRRLARAFTRRPSPATRALAPWFAGHP